MAGLFFAPANAMASETRLSTCIIRFEECHVEIRA